MQDGNANFFPARPWRVIAQELARETNPRRVIELSEELNRALAEQTSNLAKPFQDGSSTKPVDKP
jgi:predicted P-loop ATPase/GTPase